MRIEWPTLGLIAACYAAWAGGLALAAISPGLAIAALMPVIALHASLQHEVLHGAPDGRAAWGTPLVYPSLNLAIPFRRFREQHLAHHSDATLTDPYDDPESNYLDPARWTRMPLAVRTLWRANNTLLGRMLLGPALGQVSFMIDDARRIARGEAGIARAWVEHAALTVAVLAVVAASPMPVWAYALAAYGGLAILRIRTFAEHRAHEAARGRTVVIEDRGLLAFLFLNNNLHVVHHMHPRVPWYRLPALYHSGRERYLRINHGYRFDSYAALFRQHLLRAKDPVPHPFYPLDDGGAARR